MTFEFDWECYPEAVATIRKSFSLCEIDCDKTRKYKSNFRMLDIVFPRILMNFIAI